ncbi:hypothetical protein GN956_G24343 [Arapaima gigas]
MEAGLSVSLLRDQLGAVIEQAVTAAVETVLGEMARLVGGKFEEFRKEMMAKEKENESIRQMLEISRCQMKSLRKYLSAMGAKDERQAPGHCNRSGEQQAFPPVSRPNTQGPPGDSREGSPEGPSLLKGGMKLQSLQGSSCGRGRCPETQRSNPSPVSKAIIQPAADTGSQTAWSSSLQPKEEEAAADIDVICIKEEPEELETCSLDPPCPPSEVGGQGRELVDRQNNTLPPVVPSEELMAAFTLVSPGTYPEVHNPLAGPLLQARRRQWLGDPCEDYRHRKAELKRRSQHRRRELEKNLPQPLLNALVRERREKTRLRVARWRAKRKLQASLMAADAAQFSCPPGQHGEPLRCQQQPVGAPQFNSLLYGDAAATRYPGLPFNSHPLLTGLRHNIANAVLQTGAMSSTPQGMLGTDVLRTEPSGPPDAPGGLTAGILKP